MSFNNRSSSARQRFICGGTRPRATECWIASTLTASNLGAQGSIRLCTFSTQIRDRHATNQKVIRMRCGEAIILRGQGQADLKNLTQNPWVYWRYGIKVRRNQTRHIECRANAEQLDLSAGSPGACRWLESLHNFTRHGKQRQIYKLRVDDPTCVSICLLP